MSTDSPIQQAIKYLQKGDRDKARQLLENLLQSNPNNEIAWLVLSAVDDDPMHKQQCFEKVLAINSENEIAKKELSKLELKFAELKFKKVTIADRTSANSVKPKAANPPKIIRPIESKIDEPSTTTKKVREKLSVKSKTTNSSKKKWLLGVIFGIIFLCLFCGTILILPTLFNDIGEARVTRVARATVPIQRIPPTNTARPLSQSTNGSITTLCQQAEDYGRNIANSVYNFATIANQAYEATTGDELALIIVALGEPYEEFKSIPRPDCVANSALKMEQAMNKIALTIFDYATGEIENPDVATERVHDGYQLMLEAYEEIVTLGGGETESEYSLLSTPAPLFTLSPLLTLPASIPIPTALPVGSSIIVDDGFSRWEVRVDRIEYRDEISLIIGGDLVDRRLPTNRFVVLFLSGVNRGQQTDFLFPIGLEIRDSAGNVYELDEIATQIAESFIYNLDTTANQAHPGETAHSIAVFDLPFGVGPFTLYSSLNGFFNDEPQSAVFLGIPD